MRVLQLGFGTVGRENVRLLRQQGHELAGIVTRNADKQSVLEQLAQAQPGFAGPLPVVETDLAEGIAKSRPDLILQATSFDPEDLVDVVRTAAAAGCDIISVNPIVDLRSLFPDLFAEVDRIARDGGIRVVGVGVIPGFFSDVLPLVLTGACADVAGVKFRRSADFSGWGRATMKAFGFGLTPEAFEQQAQDGRITLFRGLWQSANLIASELGWQIEAGEETRKPLVSERARKGSHIAVEAGHVGGFSHRVVLHSATRQCIDLEVAGYLDPRGGEEPSAMSIEIEGDPQLRVDFHGDVLRPAGSRIGSSARMINSIKPLATIEPGFRTAADLALVCGR